MIDTKFNLFLHSISFVIVYSRTGDICPAYSMFTGTRTDIKNYVMFIYIIIIL